MWFKNIRFYRFTAPLDLSAETLEEKLAEQFVINQDCELFNPLEDSNVIRCKGQDLGSDEIKAHLLAGKQVKKLGVVWNDTLSCPKLDQVSGHY